MRCIAIGVFLMLTACVDFTREPYGQSGESCYIEGTCDDGFICVDGTCIEACGPTTCSGHGTCSLLDGAEQCACDAGFEPLGNQCLGTSEARVTHASRDLGTVDFYVSGEDSAFATNVSFGEAGLVSRLGPGSYVVTLRRAGLPPESAALAISPPFTVQADASYELVVSGALAPGANERAVTIRSYTEADLTKPALLHAGGTIAVDAAIAGLAQISDLQPLEAKTFVAAASGPTSIAISGVDSGATLIASTIPNEPSGKPSLVIFARAPLDLFPDGFALLVLDTLPSVSVVALHNAVPL